MSQTQNDPSNISVNENASLINHALTSPRRRITSWCRKIDHVLKLSTVQRCTMSWLRWRASPFGRIQPQVSLFGSFTNLILIFFFIFGRPQVNLLGSFISFILIYLYIFGRLQLEVSLISQLCSILLFGIHWLGQSTSPRSASYFCWLQLSLTLLCCFNCSSFLKPNWTDYKKTCVF